MTLSELKPQMRVAYVRFDGSREYGTVSSVNHLYAFVRFDKHVATFGWDGATSQSCDPRDLVSAEVIQTTP